MSTQRSNQLSYEPEYLNRFDYNEYQLTNPDAHLRSVGTPTTNAFIGSSELSYEPEILIHITYSEHTSNQSAVAR